MSARSVLVVDDEEGIQRGLERLLTRHGYTVVLASNGDEALERLKQHAIGAIISDKDMPGMSGVTLLGLVRDRYPRICRIMLTGRADLEGAMGAINEGEVFRFIEKPWNSEHLLSTLYDAFEIQRLEEENRALSERADRLLLNVLPRPIAARLKNGETLIAERFENATVLFSDLVDFTQLSAAMAPGALVGLLNDVFSAFDALAEEHGVEKIKTLGDGYLCAAGVPKARPDHVQAIAEVALRMGPALAAINGSRGTRLALRIGFHTGPVVAGVIGLKKFSYDLWGDTVNMASRMEALSAPGRIHVTGDVRDALEGKYTFEPRGAVEVKGKGTLETFFLLGRAH